jgi:hypothetical protein
VDVGIALHFREQYNPVHRGRRLYAWADQAMWHPDPAARREAVGVLREALPRLEGERQTQFLLDIAGAYDPARPGAPLPPEMLPFLLDALEIDEHPHSYPAVALRRLEGPDVVTALVGELRKQDPGVRERAAAALSMMDSRAREAVPALEEALHDEDRRVRAAAASALKDIDPNAAARAGVPRD